MEHRAIRGKMYQAAYQNISKEASTVRYIFNALDTHPRFRDAAPSLSFAGLLDDISFLQNRLMEEESTIAHHSTLYLKPQNHDGGMYIPEEGRRGLSSALGGYNKYFKQELQKELGPLVKTELDEIKTQKWETKPRTAHGTTSQAPLDFESDNGKFILNSTANQSLLKTIPAAA